MTALESELLDPALDREFGEFRKAIAGLVSELKALRGEVSILVKRLDASDKRHAAAESQALWARESIEELRRQGVRQTEVYSELSASVHEMKTNLGSKMDELLLRMGVKVVAKP